MLVQRGDQPVDQRAEQARGLQAGDLLLLEGVLHMLLDAREMAAERARAPRRADTAPPSVGQRGERVGRGSGGALRAPSAWGTGVNIVRDAY